jgi:hypothetical protein
MKRLLLKLIIVGNMSLSTGVMAIQEIHQSFNQVTGIGVAVSGDPHGMALNPASLSGLPQSSLQQSYVQSDCCQKASQNIILVQPGILALGGQINLFYSPFGSSCKCNT